ncbi:MAG TPA: hypothetical protein VD814_10085, partial [Nocardioides sp.]|nr:hypothetical protein [Nocardioides sp.]
MLDSLEAPHQSLHEVLRTAHSALPPQLPAADGTPRASQLVADLGWSIHPTASALRSLEQALVTLEEIGAPAQQDALARYAQAARQLAEREVASVPRG